MVIGADEDFALFLGGLWTHSYYCRHALRYPHASSKKGLSGIGLSLYVKSSWGIVSVGTQTA